MENRLVAPSWRLQSVDPEVAEVIGQERLRQQENIELNR